MSYRSKSSLGRNEPCHCGSGKKYKKCCLREDQRRKEEQTTRRAVVAKEIEEYLPVLDEVGATDSLPSLLDSLDTLMETSRALDSFKARAETMSDEDIFAELRELGAVCPEEQLEELIRSETYIAGLDLQDALEGIQEAKYGRRRESSLRDESLAASLIELYWERHVPELYYYSKVQDIIVEEYERQECGETSTSEERLGSMVKIWRTVLNRLPEHPGTIEEVSEWSWEWGLELDYFARDLMKEVREVEEIPERDVVLLEEILRRFDREDLFEDLRQRLSPAAPAP